MPGKIEAATLRELTHIVGHNAADLWGRQEVTTFVTDNVLPVLAGSNNSTGAALVGYDPTTTYPANTVGSALAEYLAPEAWEVYLEQAQFVQTVWAQISTGPEVVSANTWSPSTMDYRERHFTSNTAVSVVLPNDTTLSVGDYFVGRRMTTANVTWSAASGATVSSYPAGTRIAAPKTAVVFTVIVNTGTNVEWIVEGAVS
jgi:hypothetical protein